MTNIIDPENNYAYDVHQYLDSNGSGGSSQIVSETIGAERLSGFTQWLKDNNRRGFLGEFAVANSTVGAGIGDEAISNMLTHVEANSDVWLGWSWWAAGPWWGEYMFTLEPANLSSPIDRAAMNVLENFIPIPVPALELTGTNQFRFLAQASFLYQLQTSPDLVEDGWTDSGLPISGTNQTVTVIMPVEAGSNLFYRVRANRPP
jgi:hypothetical protein